MAVEHEALAAARALPDTEGVRAPVLDLLPLAAQAHLLEELAHELGHRLLAAGEAPDAHHPARRVDEPLAVDGDRRLAHPCSNWNVTSTSAMTSCSPASSGIGEIS